MRLEDVRCRAILGKCKEITEKKGEIEAFISSGKSKESNCKFIESVLFVLCEYIDDMGLNDKEKYSLSQDLINNTKDLLLSEAIRIHMLNLVFKCYLKTEDRVTYDYAVIINQLLPKSFENLELLH